MRLMLVKSDADHSAARKQTQRLLAGEWGKLLKTLSPRQAEVIAGRIRGRSVSEMASSMFSSGPAVHGLTVAALSALEQKGPPEVIDSLKEAIRRSSPFRGDVHAAIGLLLPHHRRIISDRMGNDSVDEVARLLRLQVETVEKVTVAALSGFETVYGPTPQLRQLRAAVPLGASEASLGQTVTLIEASSLPRETRS